MSIFDFIYIHLNQLYRKLRKQNLKANSKKIFDYIQSANFEYGLSNEHRTQKIVISLTTFLARLDTIELCLKSLCLQTVKPDKIIIWLDSDGDNDIVSSKLSVYNQYGIEFFFQPEQLKSHKKYYYAIQKFPNDIIITVDDDAVYSPDLVESLLIAHKKNPRCVCARRVHYITRKFNRKIHSYNNWINNYIFTTNPSNRLIATGIGGVLYPPKVLFKDSFDKEKIEKLCLHQDDIWLKYMELLQGTKVVWAKNNSPEPYTVENSQNISLSKLNVGNSENDICIEKLTRTFKLEIDGKKI